MTGSRGVRRTSVLRLATEPTKAAFCITAFVDVNEASLLAFFLLGPARGAYALAWVYKNTATSRWPQTLFVGSGLKLQRNSVTETGAATAMGMLIHAPASPGQSTSSTVP